MRVIALVDDLMDRSRISGAVPDVTFTRDPAATAGADVVVVDLARHASSVAPIRAATPSAHLIAFGPHVDDQGLDQARRDGADEVVPRSVFFRDPAALVLGGSGGRRPE
jgi:hypothetical protein